MINENLKKELRARNERQELEKVINNIKIQQELNNLETLQLQELNNLKVFICDELKQLKDDTSLNQKTLNSIIGYIEKIETTDDLYFLSLIKNSILNWDKENKSNLNNELDELFKFIHNKILINDTYIRCFSQTFESYFTKMSSEILKFGKLNDIYKNNKTYRIYQKVGQINNAKYNFYIYFAIGFGVIGLLFSIFGKIIFTQCFFGDWCILEYNDIDYWIMKVSIIFITITGVTFCLKQAIHHQKKKDRAEQTRLELEALPTYMFNFSDEQKNQVYAELTSKYFGRDFDKEGYQDMSNLVQEQIKLSHEVLKTTIANQQNGNKS